MAKEKILKVKEEVLETNVESVPCIDCAGTGLKNDALCSACKGNGKI